MERADIERALHGALAGLMPLNEGEIQEDRRNGEFAVCASLPRAAAGRQHRRAAFKAVLSREALDDLLNDSRKSRERLIEQITARLSASVNEWTATEPGHGRDEFEEETVARIEPMHVA